MPASVGGEPWGSVSSWAWTPFLLLLTKYTSDYNLLPFGNRFQTSSCSKNSSRQTKHYCVYSLLGPGIQQGVGQKETYCFLS